MGAAAIWDGTADRLRQSFGWWGGELREIFGLDHLNFASFGRKSMTLTADESGWLLVGPDDSAPALRLEFDEAGLPTNTQAARDMSGNVKTLNAALGPQHVLARFVDLPLATESNLRQALGLQLDRLMPLSPDSVHWDYEIVSRDRKAGQLHVHLAIMRKEKVEEIAQLSEALGLEFGRVGLAQDNTQRPIAFHFVDQSAPKKESGSQTTLGLSALVLLSLAAFLAALEWSREREVTTLTTQVRAAEAQAAGAIELKAELDSLSESQSYLSARMNDMTVSARLADVTRALPDTAYLTNWSLDGNRLILEGFAQDSQSLVPALDALPWLQSAQLQPGRGAPAQGIGQAFQVVAQLERPRP